jgi:hypothetical protein
MRSNRPKDSVNISTATTSTDDEHRFGAILDAIPEVIPIKITFDDGNISDCPYRLGSFAASRPDSDFLVCAGANR